MASPKSLYPQSQLHRYLLDHILLWEHAEGHPPSLDLQKLLVPCLEGEPKQHQK